MEPAAATVVVLLSRSRYRILRCVIYALAVQLSGGWHMAYAARTTVCYCGLHKMLFACHPQAHLLFRAVHVAIWRRLELACSAEHARAGRAAVARRG